MSEELELKLQPVQFELVEDSEAREEDPEVAWRMQALKTERENFEHNYGLATSLMNRIDILNSRNSRWNSISETDVKLPKPEQQIADYQAQTEVIFGLGSQDQYRRWVVVSGALENMYGSGYSVVRNKMVLVQKIDVSRRPNSNHKPHPQVIGSLNIGSGAEQTVSFDVFGKNVNWRFVGEEEYSTRLFAAYVNEARRQSPQTANAKSSDYWESGGAIDDIQHFIDSDTTDDVIKKVVQHYANKKDYGLRRGFATIRHGSVAPYAEAILRATVRALIKTTQPRYNRDDGFRVFEPITEALEAIGGELKPRDRILFDALGAVALEKEIVPEVGRRYWQKRYKATQEE